jgi:hypothetical protein
VAAWRLPTVNHIYRFFDEIDGFRLCVFGSIPFEAISFVSPLASSSQLLAGSIDVHTIVALHDPHNHSHTPHDSRGRKLQNQFRIWNVQQQGSVQTV